MRRSATTFFARCAPVPPSPCCCIVFPRRLLSASPTLSSLSAEGKWPERARRRATACARQVFASYENLNRDADVKTFIDRMRSGLPKPWRYHFDQMRIAEFSSDGNSYTTRSPIKVLEDEYRSRVTTRRPDKKCQSTDAKIRKTGVFFRLGRPRRRRAQGYRNGDVRRRVYIGTFETKKEAESAERRAGRATAAPILYRPR